MISIDKAKESLFRNSTKEELREYCKMLGIKFQPAHGEPALQKLLCKELGLTVESTSPVANVLQAIKPTSRVVPDINLDPEGIWGGKRFRVRVMRPFNAHDKDTGTHIFANGSYGGNSKGYPIRYGATQVIPAPILARLREVEHHRHYQESIGQDVVTEWTPAEPIYNVEVIMVEPGTEHLPSSMLEWYQLKGYKWFTEIKSIRDLQTVAGKLGIDTHTRNPENKKTTPLTHEELLANINTFVFGYPEVSPAEAA